mgnify:CR=1 FL=1
MMCLKQKKDYSEGFSTPFAMIAICSLSLMIISLSMLVLSKQKKIVSYRNMYESKREAKEVLNALEKDFQGFKEESNDNFENKTLLYILDKYAQYDVSIVDVSTGVNKRFLSSEIYNAESMQNFLTKYGEEVESDYGWIHSRHVDSDVITALKKEFEKDILFPLVNQFPLYNIYFMNEDFIKTLLAIHTIEYNELKMVKLFNLLYDTSRIFEKKDMCALFGITENNALFDFVGTKTTFWRVRFKTKRCFVQAVIALIVNDENKIEKYMIVEKHITYLNEGMI